MKNEVNRAFMAKKKKLYISPLTEATSVNSLLMALTGPASVLSGPGSQAPKRRTEVF